MGKDRKKRDSKGKGKAADKKDKKEESVLKETAKEMKEDPSEKRKAESEKKPESAEKERRKYSKRKVASNWHRYKEDNEEEEEEEREEGDFVDWRGLTAGLSIDSVTETGSHFQFQGDEYLQDDLTETKCVNPLVEIDCDDLADSLMSLPMGRKLDIASVWLPGHVSGEDDSRTDSAKQLLPSKRKCSRQRGRVSDEITGNAMMSRTLSSCFGISCQGEDAGHSHCKDNSLEDKNSEESKEIVALKTDTVANELEDWLDSVI
eukprot:m.76951 g.76951  ORF g.76951 m.76951 type:complete len:262 (+) comp36007_c0_seq15:101-886(+)